MVKPIQGSITNAKIPVQSLEKNLMIDGVESHRHIQQHQDDILTAVYRK